jgi:acyl-CoA thioester hydrolase
MATPFVHELRVRYGECDPQGIVFNANYLAYFDVAYTELWREAVGPWSEMAERGFDSVVAHASLDFRSPARFDDVIGVHLATERLGTTSITTRMEIRRGDELLVEGVVRHVILSLEDWRPAPIPDWIGSALARFAG